MENVLALNRLHDFAKGYILNDKFTGKGEELITCTMYNIYILITSSGRK